MSDFILPDIGEGIVECELVKWLISEGDEIEEDQPVAEVMTDKALVEIPAPHKGRVIRLYYQEGETAKVHAPLFAVQGEEEEKGGDAPSAKAAPAASEEEKAAPAEAASGSPPEPPPAAEASGPRTAAGAGPHGRIPASPAVRRLLRERELRLEDVPGSGKDGRVLKEDVLAFDERGEPAEARERAPAPSDDIRREPIKGMRAAMARRMSEAAASIPHFSYGDEIDVTELLALRERLKPEAERQDVRLTLMALIMKAVALAVREYPILNSRISEGGDEIHYLPHCNLGMAVDGRAGLIVPNVKRVETLSVLEIAAEVQRLTQAAREGRVDQADLKDGTLSISNIGALGGTYAAPIINAPEVAIVALGRTQWLPRFDERGGVVSRAIMTITWAGDHRILDGGTIARFCNCWKGYLEAPQSMLLNMV